VEQRDPAVCKSSGNTGGRGERIKAPLRRQDLRRRR
jgi:RNA-directed DNA polymerase